MTKTKILAAAVLSLTAGALLPQSAVAASFSLNDFLRGGEARTEATEVASANRLDDDGVDADRSTEGRGSDDNNGGRDNDGGNDHDSDGGSDHDSDGGNDHDSDGGSDHDSDGGNDHDSDSD